MKKRVLSLALVFLLLFSLMPMSVFADGETSGTCTDIFNSTYTLENGVLTVSSTGSGTCTDEWRYYFDPLAVTAVVIGDGVTTMNSEMFKDCHNLKTVTLSDNVDTIGSSVFNNCTALEDVDLGRGVKTIYSYAFNGCTALKSIVIPDSVSSIGYCAFSGCTALEDITLGSGLTTIDQSTFENTAYYNDEANWEDDILYLVDCLIAAKPGISGAHSIKDGTRLISQQAFKGCEKLTAVSIPDSVTNICAEAFLDCTALADITLGSGLTNIGQQAFGNTAYYNDEANWDGDYLYLGDCLLTAAGSPIQEPCVVKEGTRLIAAYALEGKNEIPSLTLPESLEVIGDYAFFGCSSITKLHIPANVTCLGSSAFMNCSWITELVIEEGLTAISDNAFRGCYWLAEVDIPAGVSSIGDYAFDSCFSLVVVYIPDSVKTIGDAAFSGCNELTDVHYGGTEDAWNDITIGVYNGSLTGAAYIHYGSNASTTGDSYTENGITYTLKDGTLTISGNSFCTDAWKRKFDSAAVNRLVIENGVTAIRSDAFSDCTELKEVSIASSVTEIFDHAFAGCTALESLTIPDSVTNIGYWAFSGCTVLKSVSIGSGLGSSSCKAELFEGCTALENISVSEENPNAASVDNALYIKYNDQLNTLVIVPAARSGDFTVPAGVKVIGSNAFDSCSLITSVTLPDSVKNIQPYAFKNCSSLKSLTIPGSVASIGVNVLDGCTALTDIYYTGTQRQWELVETDLGKDKLANVEVHFITDTHTHLYADTVKEATCTESGWTRHECYCGDSYIDSNVDALGHDYKDNVCTRCGLRNSWTDENGVSYVLDGSTLTVSGSGSFDSSWIARIDNTGIKKVVIESGITGLDNWAFSTCTALESVTLPAGLTSIGHQAFYDCSSLESVTIPDGVTLIANGAFFCCRSLKSVTIPNSLVSIGASSFGECTSLKDVYYTGTEAQWKTISMGIDNDSLLNATIHYGNAPAPTGAFTDVPLSAYYAVPVAWAVDKGITGGYPDNTFRPMNVCTRAQIVTFIWRANGSPEPAGTAKGFNDVAEGTYYYKAVLWAAEKGITGGFDDGGFHPDELVTRAQAMTFLWRSEGSFLIAPDGVVNTFKDVRPSNYYYEAVLWAVGCGITGGYDSTTFGSMDGCTRAQIVTFLYRTMA